MLTFSKMHGIGNDYIYINCFQETVTDPAFYQRLFQLIKSLDGG